ncbi:MAG TPA: hypothetical protein VFN38_10940 [Gemmatimonadaceae bacterium]|nr:hypothetical protein [Gemmatimonadaceae bacterium]
MKRITRHLRGNAVAYLALFIALGGTSYAASQLTGDDIRNSSLTGADIASSSVKGGDIVNSSLAGRDVKDKTLTGADVLDGSLTGADLKPGEVAPHALFAVVDNDDGTPAVARQFGATGVTDAAPGVVDVEFNQNVTTCAFTATQGTNDNNPSDNDYAVVDSAGANEPDRVRVRTFDAAGQPQDDDFHLVVTC